MHKLKFHRNVVTTVETPVKTLLSQEIIFSGA